MKKTISLIMAMFLLLSSCGKIRELMNPTSDTSAQAKAAAEAQAKAAAEAQAKAAIEPEIKTPSESEKKSEETKEITAQSETGSKETTEITTPNGSETKSEEKIEEKKTDYMWYVRAAGYTAMAAGMIYLIYHVFDMCHKEPIQPQPHAVQQQNQQQANALPDTNEEESESIPEEMLKTAYNPILPNLSPPEAGDGVESDYSDTPVEDATQNGDGVQFDIFNYAQAHGYPNNKLSGQGNKFRDTPPAASNNDWRVVSRSGELVSKASVPDYLEAIGWEVSV